jgi:MFS transporter, OPA family, glycerol-3-phosphate transporter
LSRSQLAVIAALLVAYGSFYLCRANVDAALPLLIRDEGFDKTRLGTLSSIATLVYAVGKVVLGSVGDSLGGRRLMLIAVAGSVACSLAFGASHTFAMLVALAAANRFFQAGGWPGLVHIVSRRFESSRHGRIMGVLSTSYELGNVCALTLSGAVARLGWRALFIVNPLLFAALGGAALFSLPAESRPAPLDRTAEPAPSPGSRERVATFASQLPRLLRSGALWMTVVLSALLTFIRIGFLTWTPTYLAEVSHATGDAEISASIVKSAMFPAAGVVAALCVGPIGDRLGPGKRAPIIAVSLAVVVVLVLALAHGEPRQPAFLIAAIGLFLLGPYSLIAGAMALDVGGQHGSAAAAGIIDGAGYLGATLAPYLLGRVSDRAGWSAAFDVIAFAALVSALVSVAWSIVVARRLSSGN